MWEYICGIPEVEVRCHPQSLYSLIFERPGCFTALGALGFARLANQPAPGFCFQMCAWLFTLAT